MIVACLVLAGTACSSTDSVSPRLVAADTSRITVDNAVALQTIAGFGGTTLPLVYADGDHLGPYRAAAIKAAFGDVGISLGMLSIGTAETPVGATDRFAQRANDNADPFTINAAGFDFTDSDVLRAKILTPAAAYGFGDLTLGTLLNLRGQVSWLIPIRTADYNRYLDEAAENVLALIGHWRDAYGITPRQVLLFNEPTTGNVELQTSSVQEVVDLVHRVGDRLKAAGFTDLKFVVPNEETMSRSLQVAQAILADAGARPYVGAIGFHQYPYGSAYSSPRRILASSGTGVPDAEARQQLEQLKALGQQYGVPLWMTEVTEGPGNADYSFDAIENVLARAIHIHDVFEYGGASAFFGMNTLWDSQTHDAHFAGRNVPFLSDHSSIVLIDDATGATMVTGMGYAISHYAHWLRPGAIRIAATSDKPDLIVTAFRDPPRNRIVVVAVNNGTGERLLQVHLNGATAGTANGEESYGGIRWRLISDLAPTSAGAIEFLAPAKSVVTLAIPIQ
jgi:O-glycosyl hydrolase